jgi:tellurite resistance protein TerC
MNEILLLTLRKAKRLVIAVIGFTILLIGVAMIVLPGPAFIVIPVGLGILATEFVWAKKLLKKVKEKIDKNRNNFRGLNSKK